ncbi:SRPBCC family protein [Kitasatospora sp. RB6PN24]|uniref:SRPBCC family protein n=1 Tax=Kitasatospora humi TaxID=2893891 RepID=UPI001E4ACA3D|nr:SRPBCC family protein [Kitasatospora humi]MCC9305819.1 SRPBCC family protein [Kitasatospora humi]
MRMADGPTVECEIQVAGPVARVWELVADINLPARLSPELQRAAWLDGAGTPALGARFEGHNRHEKLGEWRTVSEVVELEPERVFAWAVMDADGRFGEPTLDPARRLASWRFELHPVDGGTRLRQTAVLGPGRNGLSLAIERWPDREEEFVASRRRELRAGMEATLRGIKALVEHGS